LWDRVGTALAVGYLLVVVCFEVLRRTTGFPTPAELAASPAAVASHKAWLLLTSALIVNGPPLLELSGVIAAVVLLIRSHGALTFWLVAFVSHVGATLLAYAGVGLLWLTSPSAVENVVDRYDYGVSAAWMGVLGALFASAVQLLRAGRGRRWERFLLVVCLGSAVVSFSFFPLLAGAEHVLAFALGAAVLLVATGQRAPGMVEAAPSCSS
jgi:hypothetical protein